MNPLEMLPRLRGLSAALASLFLVMVPCTHAAEKKPPVDPKPAPHIPIASYGNTAETWKMEEERVFPFLKARGIQPVSCGSAGSSLFVPATQENRARRLLAGLILREKLPITLTRMNAEGTRWIPVTPQEVLKEEP